LSLTALLIKCIINIMPLESVQSSILKDVHAKYPFKGLTFCSY